MITMGRTDLVRAKPLREKKPKSAKTTQQELGCSDDLTDSFTDSEHSIKDKLSVQNPNNGKHTISTSPEIAQKPSTTLVSKSFLDKTESENHQSTGEHKKVQTNKTEQENPQSDKQESKTIMSSIKSFFKFQMHNCLINIFL